MRTGLIAEKLGMTRLLTAQGEHIPLTLFRVENCEVVSVRTTEKNGYSAVQLGVGNAKPKNTSKALRGHFAKSKVTPKRKTAEFRVSEDALLQPGDKISVEHFMEGQYVDVTGTTIGRGFAGSMKRHNFGGLRASHGVSITHRSHGSTGSNQDPGRVFKNKKMAGHMGTTRVTVQNLQIIFTNVAEGVIGIKGCVPGVEGSYVLIRDAVKKALPDGIPFPAALLQETKKASKEESKESTSEGNSEGHQASKTPEQNVEQPAGASEANVEASAGSSASETQE